MNGIIQLASDTFKEANGNKQKAENLLSEKLRTSHKYLFTQDDTINFLTKQSLGIVYSLERQKVIYEIENGEHQPATSIFDDNNEQSTEELEEVIARVNHPSPEDIVKASTYANMLIHGGEKNVRNATGEELLNSSVAYFKKGTTCLQRGTFHKLVAEKIGVADVAGDKLTDGEINACYEKAKSEINKVREEL